MTGAAVVLSGSTAAAVQGTTGVVALERRPLPKPIDAAEGKRPTSKVRAKVDANNAATVQAGKSAIAIQKAEAARDAAKQAQIAPEASEPAGDRATTEAASWGSHNRSLGQARLAAAPPTGTVVNGRGDYAATPLGVASTWSGGGSSGSFSWSYPVAAPEPATGPAPDLTFAYSSASIDGRVSNTNNQPSWVGEGWEFANSYVERSYNTCKDDGQANKYDLCWKSWNASMVLNGKSSELLRNSDGTWRLKDDDSSKVELVEGAANTDANGEHWRITTSDGTQYNFGLNTLPGGAVMNSTWSVPVFGDDAGEPCNIGTTFNSNSCMQGWKWNLDYVVDRNGNAMTYKYALENNMYFKSGTTTTGATYQRGGYLTEIRYGLRTGALTANTGYRAVFTPAERCLVGACTTLDSTTKANWPDVPYDSICSSGSCSGKTSPTFFTRKRLTAVTTSAWNATLATPAYQEVDRYELTHAFLDPGDTGDSTDQSLFVSKIQRKGRAAGTEIVLPANSFGHSFLPNRVDGVIDGILPLNKPRITSITTETGASTLISYTPAECVVATKPTPSNNTSRCFPTYWFPNNSTTKVLDWFHRYPVASVTVDAGAGSPAVTTSYTYTGGMAWHYDDSPLTVPDRRTWSEARGYGQVTTFVGSGTGRTKTVAYYLRGMDGDETVTPPTTTSPNKQVDVTGVESTSFEDLDQYAGFLREEVTYLGDTPTLVSGAVHTPWSRQTSSRANGGTLPQTLGHLIRTQTTTTWEVITGQANKRKRTVATTFDNEGFATSTDDDGGGAPGGASCTLNTYGRNLTANILDTIVRTQVLGVRCANKDTAVLPATIATSGNVISDTLTLFDSPAGTWTATQTPTAGNPSWTGRVNGYTVGRAPIVGPGSRTLFDAVGRPTSVTDELGRQTTTAYVPTAGFPVTRTTVTPPLITPGTVTDYDPRTGGAVKTTDANLRVTEQTFDALRRPTGVWLPTTPKATNPTSPDTAYVYKNSTAYGDPSSIATTATTTVGTTTTYTFYDGLMRPVQTQEPTAYSGGGRQISDTFFDDEGRTYATLTGVWNSSPPANTRFNTMSSTAPIQNLVTYDGAGRAATSTLVSLGVAKYTTTSTYTGESIRATAPAGGTATEVFTDAIGRETKRAQYPSPQLTGTPVETATTYDSNGRKDTVTGPGGAVWSYDYDLYGRTTTSNDPDSGQSTVTYDAADQPATTTDARGTTITTTYDTLGRPKSRYVGTGTEAQGKLLASYAYDTVANAKGRPASATSYVGSVPGTTGKAYTRGITGYDAEYNVTGSSVTLPPDDPFVLSGVPATTAYSASFTEGQLVTSTQPAVAGQPAESFTHTYGPVNQLTKVASATATYLSSALYTTFGAPERYVLKTGTTAPQTVYVQTYYDTATRRVTGSDVFAFSQSWIGAGYTYTYDDAGNLTSLKDTGTTTGTGPADTQCFTYDGFRRLNLAWSPSTNDCATTPTTYASLGGPAPYWHDYDHNDDGSRAKLTDTASAGATVTQYTYGGAGNPRHALASTQVGPTTTSYSYNQIGATTGRLGPTGTETLTWDDLGRLEKVTQPVAGGGTQDTNLIYDADGELLIRRSSAANGESILYLGATEVRLKKVNGTSQPLTSQRYHSANGTPVALRTATTGNPTTTLTYTAGDRHGTSHITFDALTASITKRYTSPFGQSRGATTAWVDDKGFLGKPADATTGLTHIGAREYDSATGRFISVDPILDLSDPQSLNGYYYGNGNPGTFSDPDGRKIIDDTDAQGNATQYVKPSKQKKKQKVVKTRSYYKSRQPSSRTYYKNARVAQAMRAWAAARNAQALYMAGHPLGGPSVTLAEAYPAVPGPSCDSECGRSLGHGALDVAGLVPAVGEPADGANALWYASEGDYASSGLSAAGMVPIFGMLATGLKALKAMRAAKAPAAVEDVLGGLSKGKNTGVHTVGSDAELDDVYSTLTRGGDPVEVPNYKGSWIERGDGVRVGIRDSSKTGGRTIDIRYPDGKIGKVHIE